MFNITRGSGPVAARWTRGVVSRHRLASPASQLSACPIGQTASGAPVGVQLVAALGPRGSATECGGTARGGRAVDAPPTADALRRFRAPPCPNSGQDPSSLTRCGRCPSRKIGWVPHSYRAPVSIMELRQLKYFVATTDEADFTRGRRAAASRPGRRERTDCTAGT